MDTKINELLDRAYNVRKNVLRMGYADEDQAAMIRYYEQM